MLLHRGSVEQVFVGSIISFGFFALHLSLRPYRKTATNWLKACVEFQIFLTIQVSILMRFGEKIEEVERFFRVKSYEWLVVISFVLFVPVAFVVCTFFTIRQSRRERSNTTEMTEPLMSSASTQEPETEPEFEM